MHTSPDRCNLSMEEMETLINYSIMDAFLSPILHVSATSEQADEIYSDAMSSDPYWQAEYRELAESEITKRYNGVLPIAKQYQMDTRTLVSCLKVREPLHFEQVIHWEPKAGSSHKGKTDNFPGRDASDIFFMLTSEKHIPAIRSWNDIPWNKIGVVPKDNFYRFVKILLDRLGDNLLELWKTQEGFAMASGFDQDLVQGTYFDAIKAWYEHISDK